uniref:Cyclin N-terminal domain-containing protein n=1 Tax=Ananas comosus var. bracteatus TaxID=296719 RepID=A0A6V7Q449_ANACO|nr:unnamed protein product [Ananas comosus var. bracteatus]
MALSPSDPSSASSNLLLLLCAEDADDVASWEPHDPDPHPIVSTPPSPSPSPFDGDDRHVSVMLAAEPHHPPPRLPLPPPRPLPRRHLPSRRRQLDPQGLRALPFPPVTPCLAVSYLDRFLSSRALPGWATELVSVASVWVAAKMEETQVPGLLELQTAAEGPRRVFEPARCAAWSCSSCPPSPGACAPPPPSTTSPTSLHAPPSPSPPRPRLLPLVDFLGYRASEIAASAVLCAAREIGDSSPGCDGDELASSLAKWVSKDVVRGCRQLMEEYLIDTCPSAHRRLKPIPEPEPEPEPTPPPSPVGVLDAAAAACGSCDTQKSSPSAAPPPPPPFPKRSRSRLVMSRRLRNGAG